MVGPMRAVVLAILLSANAAGAAPWRLETDFDGAGPSVRFELDANGALTIQSGGVTSKVSIARSITRGSLQAARVQGIPTVVVHAATPPGDEAIVLQAHARGRGE